MLITPLTGPGFIFKDCGTGSEGPSVVAVTVFSICIVSILNAVQVFIPCIYPRCTVAVSPFEKGVIAVSLHLLPPGLIYLGYNF